MKKLSKFRLCGDMNATTTAKLLYIILNEIADENGEIVISQRKISKTLHISKGAIITRSRTAASARRACL